MPNDFDSLLAAAAGSSAPPKEEEAPPAATAPTEPAKKAKPKATTPKAKAKKKALKSSPPVAAETPEEPAATTPKKRGRGRPPTGKRSDEGWITRSFYLQEETDIDIEAELIQLRREGLKLDKSELADRCLRAWLTWRNGEQAAKCLGIISPRRK